MITTNFIKGTVIAVHNDEILTKTGVSKDVYLDLIDQSESEILDFMNPKREEIRKKQEKYEDLKDKKEFGILTFYGNYVTIPSISHLSVPENLVDAIYDAYKKDDKAKLEAYVNFWTFASANPDHRVRENLFWFLQKHHMIISRSGMFAAFRNVVNKDQEYEEMDENLARFVGKKYAKIKMVDREDPSVWTIFKKSDREGFSLRPYIAEDITDSLYVGNLKALYDQITDSDGLAFTDAHSKSTNIRIGKSVSIPRSECDVNQDNTCSRGLHAASASYISGGYYGTTSLLVLINPAHVVAVPPLDSYEKIRTCEYWPVGILERNDDDEIIIPNLQDGFEDDMSQEVLLSVVESMGVNNTESSKYEFLINEVPGVNRTTLIERLTAIADNIKDKEQEGALGIFKEEDENYDDEEYDTYWK